MGRPRCESSVSEPGTDEVRVHAVRLGGRRRLDTSRVFFTCGSQGLQVQEGASREEVRSTADAGHGWVEGETVRVREAIKQIPRAWPAGLGLQALDTTEGVLGLCPSCFYRHGDAAPSGSEVNTTSALAERSARCRWPAHRADRIPTRACLRVTKGTSEVDTVW